ncbi:MAG: transglycosylase SLT domain-containing protein [gamma proteobacterium symbiont of Taylorina sp.]|nr:transglycosylase SLT domain-containing protein [gamma proteobacterium symbiont of Taylorina sp.]
MFWRSISLWAIVLLVPAIAMANVYKHVEHKHWSKKYDRHFRKNTKHYFGVGFDWHWFKAQGIAESGLNPNAKSAVGAIGIMQIMPETYNEILKQKKNLGEINNPRWNIAAAIFYNRQLYKRWEKRNITPKERLKFTFASYNAGFTRILKARNKAKKAHPDNLEAISRWKNIASYAPPATRHYVRRINDLVAIRSHK